MFYQCVQYIIIFPLSKYGFQPVAPVHGHSTEGQRQPREERDEEKFFLSERHLPNGTHGRDQKSICEAVEKLGNELIQDSQVRNMNV